MVVVPCYVRVHPLPKVDDILAQLAGAKVFSKLDANSGDTFGWKITIAHYFHHTFWGLLFQQITLTQLKFLGHIVDQLDGIRADPDKTKAIIEMEIPTNNMWQGLGKQPLYMEQTNNVQYTTK